MKINKLNQSRLSLKLGHGGGRHIKLITIFNKIIKDYRRPIIYS